MSKIKKLFSSGSGISDYSARMRHIFFVNVLWVVYSLPVVTFGAASAAAQETLLFTECAEHVKTGKLFSAAFRKYFKRGSLLWLALALFSIPLIVGGVLLRKFEVKNFELLGIFFFFLLLYGILFVYAFPVLVRSEGTPMEVVVFSLLGGVRYLPWSALAVLLASIPAVMIVLSPEWFAYTLPLWLVYGFAIIAYLNLLILRRVFNKLSKYTDFLLPETEKIPVDATSGV